MIKTKNLFFGLTLSFALLGLSTSNTQAQTDSREIGVRITDFQSFGAIYKKQIAENKFNRISGSVGQIIFTEENGSLRVGLSVGREKRKVIGNKTKFIHGLNPFVNLSANFSDRSRVSQTNSNANIGLSYILGVQYDINEDFYISLETTPSIGVTASRPNSELLWGGQLGFNQNTAALSIVHTFQFKKNK